MKNPFSPSFGLSPSEYIIRPAQTTEIINTFTNEPTTNSTYMLSGVRGSGKTVFMHNIAKILEDKGWITIPLNAQKDMLHSLAAKLYNHPLFFPLCLNAKLDLSILGIGLSIEKSNPISDEEVAIENMLTLAKEKGIKILVTIDEVKNNQSMREFASAFQIFVGRELPIYMIMTGLYKNINNLRNVDSLTFLYRAFRVNMGALNISLIATKYKNIFSVSDEKAATLASLTKGYSFAFQSLGYLLWENKSLPEDELINLYDVYLADYSYEKIWTELSPKQKNVLKCLSELGGENVKCKEIIKKMESDSNKFTGYRDILIKEGIIVSNSYGHISMALPRFSEFVSYQ